MRRWAVYRRRPRARSGLRGRPDRGITPHTLRHTFVGVAADLGFSELTIAALLGHAARGVTQRYIHIDEALRLAAGWVSAEIEALLVGTAAIERRAPATLGTAGD